MIEFGGWNLPVWFSSISEEHNAVRQCAGLFDVSHMGRFQVTGPTASAFLQYVTCNDVAKLKPGKSQYTALLTDSGGTVDDLIIYKESETCYWAVVNAGNRQKDWDWLHHHLAGFDGTTLEDWSDAYALLALQGPRALAFADSVFSPPPSSLPPFGHGDFDWNGRKVHISRTGYTGEDGVEIFVPAGRAELLWDQILSVRMDNGESVVPCGLGARDTLRLEAGLPLYGHELSEKLSPMDIGFGWIVKMQKGDFIGKRALEERIAAGSLLHLYGLIGESGVPRPDCPVFLRDTDDRATTRVGTVTSGTFSPYLKRPIAMFLSPESLQPGTPLMFQVRDTLHKAILVNLPFKRRSQA